MKLYCNRSIISSDIKFGKLALKKYDEILCWMKLNRKLKIILFLFYFIFFRGEN